MVYHHLNQSMQVQNYWDGRRNLWRLKVAPRAKHFLWILSHNGVKTYDHLFRLNLGLQASCVFCSLEFEMVEHLMFSCSKTQIILTNIEAETGKNLHFLNGFTSGNWFSPSTTRFDLFTQSLIAATAWFIWKTRCNIVFRNEILDCNLIVRRALAHVREFFYSSSIQPGRNLILTNFTLFDLMALTCLQQRYGTKTLVYQVKVSSL